ncbi:hypothetical protein CU048_10870 [Beijerinckiaceae bacterium]|nr:hypothetical protein CU048_10870 [Beijerinckiaceae bacterium]
MHSCAQKYAFLCILFSRTEIGRDYDVLLLLYCFYKLKIAHSRQNGVMRWWKQGLRLKKMARNRRNREKLLVI